MYHKAYHVFIKNKTLLHFIFFILVTRDNAFTDDNSFPVF